MPYIAFELDAMERAPEVARAIGLSVGDTAWGLLQMWRWCWREKTAMVSAVHLQGFFGSPTAGAGLEAFGFVEASGLYFRVRGAERYLRLSEAKSRGGKAAAAAGNLKRGKARPAGASAGKALQQPPSTFPAAAQQPPSSTASSEQRAASSEQRADLAGSESPAGLLVLEPPNPPKPKRVPKPDKPPPDPRHHPLKLQLVEAYREEMLGAVYDFTAFDAVNVTRLLAKSEDNEEIVFRWRTAIRLSLDKFHKPKVHTLGELCAHWNAYPTPPKDTQHQPECRL